MARAGRRARHVPRIRSPVGLSAAAPEGVPTLYADGQLNVTPMTLIAPSTVVVHWPFHVPL